MRPPNSKKQCQDLNWSLDFSGANLFNPVPELLKLDILDANARQLQLTAE
jgi:hypothetical protein